MNAAEVWAARVARLRREMGRVAYLLGPDAVPQVDPAGRLRSRLDQLVARLESLPGAAAEGLLAWAELEQLEAACQHFSGLYLQLAGGLYLASGLGDPVVETADPGAALQPWLDDYRDWLDGARQGLHLQTPLVLVASSGHQLDVDHGLVRVPFLDFDLWHLPLLARALGLALFDDALAGQHPQSEALARCLAQWQPRVARGLANLLGQPAGAVELQARAFLRHLLADMLAAALCGPPYAFALFSLVLDFGAPAAYAPEEADEPLLQPAPVDRAAAVLATLRALQPDAGDGAGWQSAIARLEQLWQAAVALPGAGAPEPLLAQRQQQFAALHAALYQEALLPLAGPLLAHGARQWQELWVRYHRWAGTAWAQNEADPPDLSRQQRLSSLSGAAWLYRLDRPDRADDMMAVASANLGGERIKPYKITRAASDLRASLLQIRLDSVRFRWARLQTLLRHPTLPPADRRAVAGRFFRLLSERLYDWEARRERITAEPAAAWDQLAALEAAGQPLQEETLSFLGSVLIRRDGRDREPPALAGNSAGPPLCELADRLLTEYEERTGLAWNSRTILGPGALVDLDTEIIRIRFPDWSLWSLPVVAHEFGHVVARVTPVFRHFQQHYPHTLAAGDASTRRLAAQLEELFADVFATYSCGPAFAAAMIVLHFDPIAAHAARGDHPTHQQRVDVICHTLEAMEAAGGGPAAASFAGVARRLRELWQESLDSAGTPRQPPAAPSFSVPEVAPALFQAVAASYRLGAAYGRSAWERALSLAGESRQGGFSLQSVRARFPAVRLHDLLNVIWGARLVPQYAAHDLEAVALDLGNDYLKEVLNGQ